MAVANDPRVQISIRDITPDDASAWLATVPPLPWTALRYVRTYAREMGEGRWVLNGETIILSRTGKLLDGRKRLRACIETGRSFPCLLVEGIEDADFQTIDALRPRSAGDVLYIRGEKNHRALAAVLNVVVRYYRQYHKGAPVAARSVARDTLFALDVRPEIRESLVKTSAFRLLGAHVVAAAVHHLASRIDPTKADAFFDRVLHGPEASDDPAYLLRTAIQNSKRAPQELMLALAIRAWNAYYAGRPLKYLRWRTEGATPQKFPVLADLPSDDGADLENQRVWNTDVQVDAGDLGISVETITAAEAEKLFEGRAGNRNVVSRVVEKYARDMKAELWALNGQTIKISKGGRLLDGQHRCAAAVKTGVPFTAIVVRGLPDEVFDTLDVGPSRSLGQVLSERGERSGFALAAALHKLWLYDEGTPTLHTRRGSHAELIQVLETNPELRGSVHLCVSKGRDIVPGSAGAVTHYLATKVDASKADEFVVGLGEGANLSKESPVLALRELLRRNQGNQRKRLGEVEKWALTIKAMNAYLEGRSVRQLVWRHGSNEPFPRLLGMQESSRTAGSRSRPSPLRPTSLGMGDDEHVTPDPLARRAETVDAAFELAPT